MRINRRKIMIIGLFCLGLAIFLYPTISNEINRYLLKQQIKNYEDFKQDLWEEARTQERKKKSSILDKCIMK